MPRLARRTLAPIIALAVLTTAVPATAEPGPPEVIDRVLLDGFDRPIALAHVPQQDGLMFLAEQGGKIKRLRQEDGTWSKDGVLLDISDRVEEPEGFREIGILGIAVHPRYERNGKLYVSYTRKPDSYSVVSEFRRRPGVGVDPASERILMVVRAPGDKHRVSHLAFGPDGKLYIASGDGQAGDPEGNAQDVMSKLGKILRISPRDPDGAGGKRHTIPRSNPYVGRRGKDAIWASGFRNPWRFSFDRKTGDLWIGDVGHSRREEVNRAFSRRSGTGAGRGVDFGWNDCEGSLEYADDEGDADGQCEHDRLPTFEYANPPDGCAAVIGGYVHRGPSAREWHGLYIAADSCASFFVLDRRGRLRLWTAAPGGLAALGEDAAGRLYAVNRMTGTFSRIILRGERPAFMKPSAIKEAQAKAAHRAASERRSFPN